MQHYVQKLYENLTSIDTFTLPMNPENLVSASTVHTLSLTNLSHYFSVPDSAESGFTN